MDLTDDTLVRCPKCGGLATLADYNAGPNDEGNVFCDLCHEEIEIAANVVPGKVAKPLDGQLELF